MYAYKGGDELVEEALKMGADCVGAIPHFELAREFGEKSVHKAIELAVKYDKLLDAHCDETDDTQSRFLELLNALASMEGIGTRTTASHTCSFGSADNSYALRMMKLFKKSVSISFHALQRMYILRDVGIPIQREGESQGLRSCMTMVSMSALHRIPCQTHGIRLETAI